MTLTQEARERRDALARAWAEVPERYRVPGQFRGRHYAGCGATIGAMPRCDFACKGCYLGEQANAARPRPLAELMEQLGRIREWLGPAGNVQITDGEVSLRDPAEVVALIRHARQIGLVPMLMSHGESFRRHPGLLERFMVEGGLSELSLHIDTTQRGRRDRFSRARSESELDPLREEFAGMIRSARRRTGRRLSVASTVTVTRENLAGVAGIVRWFLANADAFKMLSFQPLAEVGRTDPTLRGVTVDALWQEIAEGAGDPALLSGEGWLGHPECTRFVQGLAVRSRDRGVRLVPLYRRERAKEMRRLDGLLRRIDGASFRLDDRRRAMGRVARFLWQHGWFAATSLLPHALGVLSRAGTLRVRYFNIVSHHFMSAAETQTPLGQERLDACAFRVPIGGRLEPMCAVNALGLREEYYRGGSDPARVTA
jgi:MoaA/NifB/PqqE/SkfB family radical SAM enzyme